MEWNQLYSSGNQPDRNQISDYIHSELWEDLLNHLESNYNVIPKIEYSCCSAKPGWNVKYKKSGRALCTLYPESGFFTCMVSIGSREASEAEMLLQHATSYVQGIYDSAALFNGGRWLMIEVTDEEILTDVKELIGTRVKPKKK